LKSELVFALLTLSLILPNLAFAEPGTTSVEVNGVTYEVNYDTTGLVVDGMEVDVPTSTLTVLIATTDISSTLEITLERSFFDSRVDGADESFVVLADFDEAVFTEETTETTRTLTITVPSGTSSIDIIGTEFGAQQKAPAEEEMPVEEEPAVQTPTETEPVEEEPAVQTPTETEPVEEEPVKEMPAKTVQEMQCGSGTVLKDGVCVLDETCGPGTTLKDGQCVLDETQQTTARSTAVELVAPIIASFVIAFIIMIVLWAIGKAGRKNSS